MSSSHFKITYDSVNSNRQQRFGQISDWLNTFFQQPVIRFQYQICVMIVGVFQLIGPSDTENVIRELKGLRD